MLREPVYREILPPIELSDIVACCWIQRGDFAPATRPTLARVLPDGCMDILVSLGDFPRPLDGDDLPTLWRHPYFIDSLKRVTHQLEPA